MSWKIVSSCPFISHPICTGITHSELICWCGCSVRPQWVQTSRTSKELLPVSFLFFKPDRSLNTKWNEVILMQMKLLLFKWSREHRVYASLLKVIGLFTHSFTIPLLMAMERGLLWWTEWTLWKPSGGERATFYFVPSLFFCLSLIFSFLLSLRYKSSSARCRPQARTEGARWGHSSVAQPSCPESHNHSGHMDGKCSSYFYI